jgi:N-acetylneuraminate synthase
MQIVAEIGASHNRKLKNVFKLIDATPTADAFKIQTWERDTMAIPGTKGTGLWQGKGLTALYNQARLPWEWHGQIFQYCREKEVMLYSSPFDKASVDFLEHFNCPAYKVASFEANDLELVKYIAQTGKPMVVSTGQLSDDEIPAVLEAIDRHNGKVMLLHCVSQYPTSFENANLLRMLELKKYGFPVGLSDHSEGSTLPIAATALGASMIEKHISLQPRGPDGGFAMRPTKFNDMANAVRDACSALTPGDDEIDTSLRRSLYFSRRMKVGERVCMGDLKTARPNLGLSPLQIDEILGRLLTEEVFKDQPALAQLVR